MVEVHAGQVGPGSKLVPAGDVVLGVWGAGLPPHVVSDALRVESIVKAGIIFE